jgi:hypothetical protein
MKYTVKCEGESDKVFHGIERQSTKPLKIGEYIGIVIWEGETEVWRMENTVSGATEIRRYYADQYDNRLITVHTAQIRSIIGGAEYVAETAAP